MARKSKSKHDIAKGGVLSKVAISSLVPKAYYDLYFQILHDLDYKTLTDQSKQIALLYAKIYVDIIRFSDIRQKTDIDGQIISSREKVDIQSMEKRLLAMGAALKRKEPKEQSAPAITLPTEDNQINEPEATETQESEPPLHEQLASYIDHLYG